MIFGVSWPVWLAWILAVFFVGNGVINLFGPKGMRDGFTRWGFPSWFHLFNGALQIVTGVLIALEPTRMIGLGLGALICFVVFATLIRHKEASHLPPGVLLLLVIVVTAWGLMPAAL
jgi:hypothetical protein